MAKKREWDYRGEAVSPHLPYWASTSLLYAYIKFPIRQYFLNCPYKFAKHLIPRLIFRGTVKSTFAPQIDAIF